MAEALKLNTQAELNAEVSDSFVINEIEALKKKALHHYELSLDAKTPNEQSVAHRGLAKKYANLLRGYQSEKVTALNLLARIALDEGFYKLSKLHLEDAIEVEPNNAGCWYSLGHSHLALKDTNSALNCFTRSMDIAPNETRSAISIAYTLAQMGKLVDAFQMYRQLIQLHPNDKHVHEKLFDIVSSIRADFYQEDLAEDVYEWLQISDANHQALAPLVMSLLRYKFHLNDDSAVIDIQDLARDKLLSSALGKIYFTDKGIERFIRQVRKQVLLNSIACEYRDIRLLNLAGRIAVHSEHNEHLYIYDEDEKGIVQALRNLIKDSIDRSPKLTKDIAHLITLYAMYESITPLFKTYSTQPINELMLPAYVKEIFQFAVVEHRNELKIAKHIPELTSINDLTSKNVKQQYEENPYPRWLSLGYNTPTNYGRALENQLVDFRAPDFFNMGTIKVLIAGAGTGRHALKVARYFRNVEVLAIDLSTRSLAYAQRQAIRYDIHNIRFLSADILQLNELTEKFHIIECSGVLHHMKDPEAGLKKLKSLLIPQGLMKLGLYSYQAREVVRQVRKLIQQFDVPYSLDGVRHLRQAILDNKMPFDFSGILASQDFYSYSGCRDLLFHVQETQYKPTEIKEWLSKEQLDFLGFVLTASTRSSYQARYPDDPKMIDLNNWQKYEEKFPATFSGMLQFYVQSKGL